jgi:hypothetical protein
MDVEYGILLQLVLCSDYRIVKGVSYNSIVSRQNTIFVILIFFLRVRFHFIWHLLCLHLLLHVIRKLHLDQKRALGTILPVAIQNSKEMLVEFLTHIWSQHKIVLILFICVTDAKSFARGVCKPGDNVGLDDFGSLAFLVLFDPEW